MRLVLFPVPVRCSPALSAPAVWETFFALQLSSSPLQTSAQREETVSMGILSKQKNTNSGEEEVEKANQITER